MKIWKRICSAAVAAAAAGHLVCPVHAQDAVPTELDSFICGDADGDMRLDLTDAILVMEYLLGGRGLDRAAVGRCDMNADGRVNGFDYGLLRAALLKDTPDRRIQCFVQTDLNGTRPEILDEAYIIDTKSDFGRLLSPTVGTEPAPPVNDYSDIPELTDYFALFDDSFFAENVLFMKSVPVSCGGGCPYEICSAAYEGEEFVIRYADTRTPFEDYVDIVTTGTGFVSLPRELLRPGTSVRWEQVTEEQKIQLDCRADTTIAVMPDAYPIIHSEAPFLTAGSREEMEQKILPYLRVPMAELFRERYDDAYFKTNDLLVHFFEQNSTDTFVQAFTHATYSDQKICFHFERLLMDGYQHHGIRISQLTVPKEYDISNAELTMQVKDEIPLDCDFWHISTWNILTTDEEYIPLWNDTLQVNEARDGLWIRSLSEWNDWAQTALSAEARAYMTPDIEWRLRTQALYLKTDMMGEGAGRALYKADYHAYFGVELTIESDDSVGCLVTDALDMYWLPKKYAGEKVSIRETSLQQRESVGSSSDRAGIYRYDMPQQINVPQCWSGLMIEPYTVEGSDLCGFNVLWGGTTMVKYGWQVFPGAACGDFAWQNDPFTQAYTVVEQGDAVIYQMEDSPAQLIWTEHGVTIHLSDSEEIFVPYSIQASVDKSDYAAHAGESPV